MKIIEAMKKIKMGQEKISDLRVRIKAHAADMDFENPVYPDQAGQVKEWLQSCFDTTQDIAKLRVAIQRTNLLTEVTIELGGKQVTKCIAEWIHRRRDLAKLDQDVCIELSDRNLKDGHLPSSTGTLNPVKVRRYFDPKERDAKIDMFRREPAMIDSTLEVVNATTDLID